MRLTESVWMFPVSAEGGGGDPSGRRGSRRHPVPAEVHPGGQCVCRTCVAITSCRLSSFNGSH